MERSERMRQRAEEFAALLQEEFGVLSPDEHGCLLSVVEDFAVEVGDQVGRALMQRQLEAGTATTAAKEEHACPACQRPALRKRERKRRVETHRGAVHVAEPEHYCSRCRRSFFPADPLVGHGA